MASTITFFRWNGSSSIIPHMLLRELKVAFREQLMHHSNDGLVPIGSEMTRTEFLRINPGGLVPMLLLDDGTVITEMPAILTYISELVPERGMMGTTVLERVKVLEWIAWLMGNLNEYGFAGLWAPHRMVDRAADESIKDAVRAKGRETIVKSFRRIEERLNGSGHAVSSQLTAVDFLLHTFHRWGRQAEIDMSAYAKFSDVAIQVETCESVKSVLEIEGVKTTC